MNINMLNRLKKILKNNKWLYRFFLSFNLKMQHLIAIIIPDIVYIKWQYRKSFGRKLNLKNPTSFNEKIQWLKLNYRDEILTICSDKYKVRDYVKKTMGEQVLTKLYGVYNSVEDIILEELPNSFVLKVTHGSGQNIICKNKSDFNWKQAFELLRTFMVNNHYYFGREFAYKNINPRIICEEYLDEGGKSPVDYKFYCFNGEPRFVGVYFDRFIEPKSNLYDMEWNLLPVRWSFPNFLGEFNRPQSFGYMYSIAKQLAQGITFVRVDLYSVDNKVYFSEMTFYPASGYDKFNPDSFDYIFGSYLQLPIEKDYEKKDSFY